MAQQQQVKPDRVALLGLAVLAGYLLLKEPAVQPVPVDPNNPAPVVDTGNARAVAKELLPTLAEYRAAAYEDTVDRLKSGELTTEEECVKHLSSIQATATSRAYKDLDQLEQATLGGNAAEGPKWTVTKAIELYSNYAAGYRDSIK